MADMLRFELVSPERRLVAVQATAVTVPGQLGDLTAMPGHAPFLTTLRPGYVVLDGGAGGRFFVTGGFAEIADGTVSVLAEEALESESVTADWLAARIAEAERLLAEAGAERQQAALQRLNDFRAAAARG